MMQWNLSYQRQIGQGLDGDGELPGQRLPAHLGLDRRQLCRSHRPAPPRANTNNRRLTYLLNPTLGQYYGDIQQTDDGANAEYHGLLLQGRAPLRPPFHAARPITPGAIASARGISRENWRARFTRIRSTAPRASAAIAGIDHRQNFNTSLVHISPGYRRAAFARLITKDWQVSPIVSMFTGNPIQITDGKDISLSGQDLDRPTVILPGPGVSLATDVRRSSSTRPRFNAPVPNAGGSGVNTACSAVCSATSDATPSTDRADQFRHGAQPAIPRSRSG